MDPYILDIINKMNKLRNAKTTSYGISGMCERVMLCDVSSSMTGGKFDGMKKALEMNVTENDGIIAFGDDVYNVPYHAINKMELSFGLTSMLPAIKEAIEKMRPSKVIMMTDGDPNKGGSQRDVIDYISGLCGVVIDCIGISDDSHEWDDFDPEFLKTLCDITGGTYQHVSDPRKLGGAIKLLSCETKAINL